MKFAPGGFKSKKGAATGTLGIQARQATDTISAWRFLRIATVSSAVAVVASIDWCAVAKMR